MNNVVAHKILELQDMMQKDPKYRYLLEEHAFLNTQFLETMETLTQAQKDAIFDYIGLLIEVHLRTLEFAVT